jgi:hypothetical protein
MTGKLFDKIHDAISQGVDESLKTPTEQSTTSAQPPAQTQTVTPPPAQSVTPPAPAAAEEEDDFEFTEDSTEASTSPENGNGEGTTPPADQPTPTNTSPAPAQGTENEDAIDWSKLPPAEVEQAFLRTNRGKQMLQRYKEMRELAKDPSEGGLGFIPNVQQIKQFHEDASGFEQMSYDFHSLNPDRMTNWANFWFEPSKNPAQLRAQSLIASQLPSILRDLNPDAYGSFARTLIGDHMVNELLEKARAQSDPQERAFFARFARTVYEYVNGESNAPDITELTGDPRPPAPDPKVVELQTQLSQRNAQDAQRRQQALVARKRTNTTKLSTERRNRYDALLAQALAPIKERLEKTVFFAPTIDNFISEVDNIVRKSPGWGRYEMLAEQAVMSGSPEAFKAANDQYFLLAKPVIKNLRTKYLRDAGALLSNQNAAAHATHQTAANSGSLPGGGAPTESAGGSAGKPARLPGESMQEWLERVSRLSLA